MAKQVNRLEPFRNFRAPWPIGEAVRFAVEWANFSAFIEGLKRRGKKEVGESDVLAHTKRLGEALVGCHLAMLSGEAHSPEIDVQRFSKMIAGSSILRWMEAAVDGKRTLSDDVANQVNVELDRFSGSCKLHYYSSGKNRNSLSFQWNDFKPTPFSYAALGIALIADRTGEWATRVGRCEYHHDRFVFNAPKASGKKGPEKTKFFCSKGCRVQASRERALLSANSSARISL